MTKIRARWTWRFIILGGCFAIVGAGVFYRYSVQYQRQRQEIIAEMRNRDAGIMGITRTGQCAVDLGRGIVRHLQYSNDIRYISGSPSFRLVAIVRYMGSVSSKDDTKITLVETDTGREVGSYMSKHRMQVPFWSRDERRIAVTTGGDSITPIVRQEVLLFSVEKDSLSVAGEASFPANGPDENTLAVFENGMVVFQRRTELWLTKFDGLDPVRIVSVSGHYPQAWSDDEVVFWDTHDIYTQSLSTGRKSHICPLSYFQQYGWQLCSPDRKQIVFSGPWRQFSNTGLGIWALPIDERPFRILVVELREAASYSDGMSSERIDRVQEYLRRAAANEGASKASVNTGEE